MKGGVNEGAVGKRRDRGSLSISWRWTPTVPVHFGIGARVTKRWLAPWNDEQTTVTAGA
jgi:hypothetical protein